jgi:hypothetical protein
MERDAGWRKETRHMQAQASAQPSYQQDSKTVLQSLNSDGQRGLTSADARQRLQQYSPP